MAAYQKVSVGRMQQIRRGVLAARSYTEGLSDVYLDIRASQRSYWRTQKKRIKTKGSQIVERPLAILLSSHSRLDGGISQATFNLFAEYIEENNSDVIVTGQVGKNLFSARYPKWPARFFDLPKEVSFAETVAALVDITTRYAKVRVFYGKFVNFIEQQPVFADLADSPITSQAKEKKKGVVVPFIFEPSLEKLVALFDTQILTALLTGTTQESSLAEHGSRVKAIEEARLRIDEHRQRLLWQQQRVDKELKDKKQREMLASLRLWQGA